MMHYNHKLIHERKDKQKKDFDPRMNKILLKCKLWLQEHNNNNKSSNKIYTSMGKDLPKIDGASTFQLCSHIYFVFDNYTFVNQKKN